MRAQARPAATYADVIGHTCPARRLCGNLKTASISALESTEARHAFDDIATQDGSRAGLPHAKSIAEMRTTTYVHDDMNIIDASRARIFAAGSTEESARKPREICCKQ